MNHNILITGLPGVGKTTAIQRIVGEIRDRRIYGFFTEEIREAGERRGFKISTFDGNEGILSHVEIRSSYAVGKYRIDIQEFERIALPQLIPRTDDALFVVDEIGKMECCSNCFVKAMTDLLDSSVTIIATVATRGSGFIAEVKRRNDVELYEITRENRDGLPAQILRRIQISRDSTHEESKT